MKFAIICHFVTYRNGFFQPILKKYPDADLILSEIKDKIIHYYYVFQIFQQVVGWPQDASPCSIEERHV